MKNLKGEDVEITALKDWEKAVVLQFVIVRGLPSWARGDDFYKLLAALCGMTEEQAKDALKKAEEEQLRTTALAIIPDEEAHDTATDQQKED